MRKGTHRFGWCLTNDHTRCMRKVGTVECSCACHNEKAPDS